MPGKRGGRRYPVLEFFNEGAGRPNSDEVVRQRRVPPPPGSGAFYIRHAGLDGGNPHVLGLLRSSLTRSATLVVSSPSPPFSVRCVGILNHAYACHPRAFLWVDIQLGIGRCNWLPLGIGNRAVPGDDCESQRFLGRPTFGYCGHLPWWSRLQVGRTLCLPVFRLEKTLLGPKFLRPQLGECILVGVSLRGCLIRFWTSRLKVPSGLYPSASSSLAGEE